MNSQSLTISVANHRLIVMYLVFDIEHVVLEGVMNVGLIQRFLYPPTERNTVVRLSLSHRMCNAEKRMNYSLLKDMSITPNDRCATFDGDLVHSMPVGIKHKSTREFLSDVGFLLGTMIGYTILSKNELRMDCPLEAIVRFCTPVLSFTQTLICFP